MSRTYKRVIPEPVQNELKSPLKPSKFSLVEEEEMNAEPFNISLAKYKEPLKKENCQEPESKVINSHFSQLPLNSSPTNHKSMKEEENVDAHQLLKEIQTIQKKPIKTQLIYGVVTNKGKNTGKTYSYLKNLETNDMIPFSFTWEAPLDQIAHAFYSKVTSKKNKNYGRRYRVYRLNDNYNIYVRGTWYWIDEENKKQRLNMENNDLNDVLANDIAHEEF